MYIKAQNYNNFNFNTKRGGPCPTFPMLLVFLGSQSSTPCPLSWHLLQPTFAPLSAQHFLLKTLSDPLPLLLSLCVHVLVRQLQTLQCAQALPHLQQLCDPLLSI